MEKELEPIYYNQDTELESPGGFQLFNQMTESCVSAFLIHDGVSASEATRIAVYDRYVNNIQLMAGVSETEARVAARYILADELGRRPVEEVAIAPRPYVDTADLTKVINTTSHLVEQV